MAKREVLGLFNWEFRGSIGEFWSATICEVLGIFGREPTGSFGKSAWRHQRALINNSPAIALQQNNQYVQLGDKNCSEKMLSKSSFRICTQCLRQTARPRSSIIPSTRHLSSKPIVRRNAFTTLRCLKAQVTEMPSQVRGYASKTAADEVIEEITELYVSITFPLLNHPTKQLAQQLPIKLYQN